MNEVAKTNNGVFGVDPKRAEKMVSLLNNNPLAENIKINSQANNSKYLPISFVENKLDEIFFGLWQIKNFRWQVIANEIVGSIELGVYHPVLKEWIWREGAGATMILQKKGADITDIGAKHKNTLVKDFPHLKTECLKNAARSLGKIFGRDLNRDLEDTYTPITEQINNEASAIEKLEECETPAALNKLWQLNPQWHKTPAVRTAFGNKKAELKGALNG